MKIGIQIIPHSKQRYETSGDWLILPKDELDIRVTQLSDWRYTFLLAVHELVEAGLCKHAGITTKQIDDFDIKYEQDRDRGKYTSDQEPGNDPDNPARKQHFVADIVERICAFALGVDWGVYSAEVIKLSK
ncbi:MAG: hypothetical protein ACYC9L_16820 [Sulfuricaulis sp.]